METPLEILVILIYGLIALSGIILVLFTIGTIIYKLIMLFFNFLKYIFSVKMN